MVEVDPITLLAAGTVVVGILTLVSCFRTEKPNPKPTIVTENTAPASVASKPKRKSKSKSKSKAAKVNSESNKPLNNGSSSEVEAVPSAALAANVVEDEEDKADEDLTEDIFVVGEASKRAKKSKETPEQKATRLERQKVTKSSKKVEDDILFSEASNSAPSTRVSDISAANASSFDGWAVVEKKNAKAKKSESASDLEDIPSLMTNVPLPTPAPVEEEIVTPPAPVDLVTKELTVEAKKLGLLIGPKGITKIGMQTATGTEISMPKVEKDHTGPVTVAVTGSAEGVDRAVYALNELCQKGYCNLLASPDFHEGYVEVKPKFLPDIIGKSGFCIRAIQQHTGVKISTPSEYTRVLPSGETVVPSKVKIILAGTRDKVSQARSLILDLTKYYYTPVTHPGLTHVEMDIPSHYYNYIIGAKGSEIKHIQANYKVNVHIPNADSVNPNLLIVGELTAVQNAEKHIQRLMEKVDERAKAEAEGIALGESAKAKFAAAAAGTTSGSGKEPRSSSRGNRAQRADRDATGGSVPEAARKGPSDPNGELKEDEEWTSEYAPRRSPINLGAMLPATAKFAAAAVSSSPASPSEPSAL